MGVTHCDQGRSVKCCQQHRVADVRQLITLCSKENMTDTVHYRCVQSITWYTNKDLERQAIKNMIPAAVDTIQLSLWQTVSLLQGTTNGTELTKRNTCWTVHSKLLYWDTKQLTPYNSKSFRLFPQASRARTHHIWTMINRFAPFYTRKLHVLVISLTRCVLHYALQPAMICRYQDDNLATRHSDYTKQFITGLLDYIQHLLLSTRSTRDVCFHFQRAQLFQTVAVTDTALCPISDSHHVTLPNKSLHYYCYDYYYN